MSPLCPFVRGIASVLSSLLCVALLGWASIATATQIEWASTQEIADSSVRAAVVRCEDVSTRTVEKYGETIFTFTRFAVEQPIFGSLPDSFTLRLFGGQIEDTILDAPSVPRFREGEQVVLLLGPDNKDGFPVVFIQGVYRTEEEAGEVFVVTPVTELPLYRASDSTRYSAIPPRVPLADFAFSLKRFKAGKEGS